MLNKTYTTLIAIILLSGCGKTELPEPQTLVQYIDQAAKPYIFTANTPGIVVGTYQNNKVNYYFYGVRDLETGLPFDANTLIEIGSITKTFTSTIFAASQLDGSIKASQTIYASLPEDIKLATFENDSIRFTHLANHTSGIPAIPANNTDKFSEYGMDELKSFLNTWKPTSKPGTVHEYTNYGMGLLGYLVSRVENETYDSLVKQKIFQPLGMSRSFVSKNLYDDANFAKGYLGTNVQDRFIMTEANQAAGSIVSTPSDMMKYLIANLNQDQTALSEAMQLAHTPTFAINDRLDIGLAWFIAQEEADYKVVWHNGGTYGFNSFIGFDEKRNQGVFVLMNSRNSTATPATELGSMILSKMRFLK
jgi:serine-type D-Ala-D-Ala carboxypeptidase/endopeptidase